jgi:hypothetical protein
MCSAQILDRSIQLGFNMTNFSSTVYFSHFREGEQVSNLRPFFGVLNRPVPVGFAGALVRPYVDETRIEVAMLKTRIN